MSDVKKLLRQMIQIAALRKEAEDAEQRSPCPDWLLRTNACSPLTASHSLNSLPVAPLHFVPNDNMNLNREYDPVVSEATGGGHPRPMTQMMGETAVRPDELMSRQLRRERLPPQPEEQESFVMPTRGSRIFPRFLGKTILNRPIRVEISRGPSSGKRALDCIRKCIVEGGLHPVQCHSIC